MKTITIVVRVNGQSSDSPDSRNEFWRAFGRQAKISDDSRELPEYYEQRLRNRLPRELHRRFIDALLSAEEPDDRVKNRFPAKHRVVPVSPGRLLVTVEAIHYGSMKIDLGIPDIDAFLELLGNNSEAFEALFGAYVPSAIDSCLPWDTSSLDFDVSVPADVQTYINSSSRTKPSKIDGTAKEKGTALLINVVQSPLILPILLICFLWYYARQDMMDERRMSEGLLQTLVTQQTAVISLLTDKAHQPATDHAATEHPATDTASQPKPKSGEKAKAD